MQFAADFAKDSLVPNINKKIINLTNMLNGKSPKKLLNNEEKKIIEDNNKKIDGDIKETKFPGDVNEKRKISFRKTVSQTDDNIKNMGITDPELLKKLESLPRPITREVRPGKPIDNNLNKNVDLTMYLEGKKINYPKVLNDEVLAADRLIVEAAKKNMDVAGKFIFIILFFPLPSFFP